MRSKSSMLFLLLSSLLLLSSSACGDEDQTTDDVGGDATEIIESVDATTLDDLLVSDAADVEAPDLVEDMTEDGVSEAVHVDTLLEEVEEEVHPQKECTIIPGGELGHPPKETYEYVQGGGVEVPYDGWEIIGAEPGATMEVSSGEAHGGTKSFHLVVDEGLAITLQQRLYFPKGFDYTWGLWVKGEAASIAAAAMGYDPQGTPDLATALVIDGQGSYADWTELSVVEALSKNGSYQQVEVTVQGPADLYVDDISLSAQVYAKAEYPATPEAPLSLSWLIHIEDPTSLVESEEYFTAKATVFEELAKVFHAHGAKLVIQPEGALLEGAPSHDPGFVARLTDEYGVTWSTHTHGPSGDDVTMDDVKAYVMDIKTMLEDQGSGPIIDHNGNFEMADLDALADIGFKTLSAYKYKWTQFPALGYYLSPWRPSDVSPLDDEAGWAVHDQAGGLVFIPGTGTSVTRYKAQLPDLVERYLTSALGKVDGDKVNVYTFVDHVDHFYSLEGETLQAYIDGGGLAADLAVYDQLFADLIDPLVASGHVTWATLYDILDVYEAWELDHCPPIPSE